MMFRSKSFNLNRPVKSGESGSLIRTKSLSGSGPSSLNLRSSIVIKEVSPKEASELAVRIYQETMTDDDWKYYNPLDFPLDEERSKWISRFEFSYGIFRCVPYEVDYKFEKEMLFFVSYFRGVPIGILELIPKNDSLDLPKVKYLTMHCGIRDSSFLLIEFAVNKSRELNKGGSLQVTVPKEIVREYIKMGFIQTTSHLVSSSNIHLELHPDQQGGKWRYNSNTRTYKYLF
ncbi:hypothetical protein [Xenorhabdus littoralis]|uniref:hypothetical protein n=1 Tax=Xenorhabdus littoralis TaxID=2582835 RepID=UPI0029E7D5A0|nr:hypothetical protein [Xenorhabdus sp. psl]MDX7992828.1 hypothetical protein [Xenorhabdus sp. psl]